jgi:5,10-methylene-tetrahydrofolate dehydrogenase/methenyl tetrahydrofolate cyclohydrolase
MVRLVDCAQIRKQMLRVIKADMATHSLKNGIKSEPLLSVFLSYDQYISRRFVSRKIDTVCKADCRVEVTYMPKSRDLSRMD